MLTFLEECCRNVVEDLKNRWEFYRHAAYLKKMGWTEEAYQKQTDPLHNPRASTARDFYFGYKHLQYYESTRVSPFIDFPTWMDAYNEMCRWCDANCQGKWRQDIHRVHKQMGINVHGEAHPEFFFNELGGGDTLFFAFEDSKDYTMFLLRWGT